MPKQSGLPRGVRLGKTGAGFEARYGNKHIGTFTTAEEASIAYEKKKNDVLASRLGLPAGVLVDKNLLPQVMSYKWTLARGYARAVVGGKETRLHRYIVSLLGIAVPDGFVVDHINRNTLDNRRENLRVISHSANILNQKRVNIRKQGNRWIAALRKKYKTKSKCFISRQCAETWVAIQRHIIFMESLNAN